MASDTRQSKAKRNVAVPPQPVLPLRDDMHLTYSEAAAYMRCTASQIERWAGEGKLPVVRLPGRGSLVRGVDIRRVLADGLRLPSPAPVVRRRRKRM